jgi:hypothetical protein
MLIGDNDVEVGVPVAGVVAGAPPHEAIITLKSSRPAIINQIDFLIDILL